jgi:hypothetical protein
LPAVRSCAWAALFKRRRCALIVLAGMLGACHVRPMPAGEYNAELPIYDIVHRIQCEAATAVAARHREHEFTEPSKKLDEIDAKIQAKEGKLREARKKLEKSDFGTRKEELDDASKALDLQAAQIELARARLASKPNDAEKKVLDAEEKRIRVQINNWDAAVTALTDVTTLDDEIKDLKDKRGKKYKELIEFEGHSAVFLFDFEVSEDNNLSSTGSVAWPAVLAGIPGSFTMGYDVGDKRQRLAKRTVKLAATFDEFVVSLADRRDGNQPKLDCRRANIPAPGAAPGTYPITGNIGLEIVIREYIAMLNSGKFKAGGESYTDKIQFTTTINGGLKPSIDLARKPGPTVKVSGDISATRKDVHALTLSLAPPEGDKSAGAQEVVISRMPAVRIRGDVIRLPPLN